MELLASRCVEAIQSYLKVVVKTIFNKNQDNDENVDDSGNNY